MDEFMLNLEDTYVGNAARLESNKKKRSRREMLVTSNDSYSSGEDALQEIFARKRERGAAFRELKMADHRDTLGLTFAECEEYGFADKEYRLAIKEGKVRGAFAGEGMSFPIASPEDVGRAWSSVGRSDQPTKQLQKNIIRIARKYNWMNGLPKSVRDRIKKGGSGLPE